jgi:hypothetical protein
LALRERVRFGSRQTALAFSDASAGRQAHVADRGGSPARRRNSTSARHAEHVGWELTGTTPAELRQQIHEQLLKHSLTAGHLHTLMAGDELLSVKVWGRALKVKMGFQGEAMLARETFELIDVDRSGVIGLAELHAWLTQSAVRRAKAVEVFVDEPTRASMEWSEDGVRRALQVTLKRAGLVPLDMMRAWDKEADGALSSKGTPPTPQLAA